MIRRVLARRDLDPSPCRATNGQRSHYRVDGHCDCGGVTVTIHVTDPVGEPVDTVEAGIRRVGHQINALDDEGAGTVEARALRDRPREFQIVDRRAVLWANCTGRLDASLHGTARYWVAVKELKT